jgi:hypothetical protein
MKFEELVKKELSSARNQHGPMGSIHEAYAVILEEIDEFWEQVKKKTKERDLKNVLEELVQISAMAQKTAEDVVIPNIKSKKKKRKK